VPDNRIEPRAHARDLGDPTFARRSLRASLDRRTARLRRRRTTRSTRSLAIVTTVTLTLGAAGAVAQQSAQKAPAKVSVAAGYDVVALQQRLGIAADGIFGAQTRRAVRRFQRANGLVVDGVVGPQTLAALGLTATAPKRARAKGARVDSATLLARIAQCESGGDPTVVSADGRYRGKYQFSRATWRAMGGTGDPARAEEAEQDRLAALLLERQGPGAWPACARQAA
jgi:hypothetical protein